MATDNKMRVSMLGVLRNAVRGYEELRDRVRYSEGWTEGSGGDDPAGDADSNIFMLANMAEHVEGVMKGKHLFDEFADFYCLKEK